MTTQTAAITAAERVERIAELARKREALADEIAQLADVPVSDLPTDQYDWTATYLRQAAKDIADMGEYAGTPISRDHLREAKLQARADVDRRAVRTA